MNVYLENTVRFLIVLLIQIFILNNIYLHGFIVPILYTYFVIKLPFKTQNVVVLLLAFLMGISIDILTGTPGINAAATTAVAFFRPYIIKMILPHLSKDSIISPSINDLGFFVFVGYVALIVFSHSLILMFLEEFGFQNFGQTLIRILLTAIVSICIIMIVEFLWKSIKKQ